MILHGRYENEAGILRPYISGFVYSSRRVWLEYAFLVDSGADVTFLHYGSLDELAIDTSNLEVYDDVGGVGGKDVPYIKFSSKLQFISGEDVKVFEGDINIFLDPHATDVPLLGRDVLDHFAVLLDCRTSQVLLLDEMVKYRVNER